MSSSEKLSTTGPEQERRKHELEKAGAELREVLRERHEKAGEHSHENLDEARREALEKAQSTEKQERVAPKQEHRPSSAERRGGQPIRKAEREASFNATMQEVRTHMTPASRAFSKVIHNKAVEKISDVASSTIARPNAILSGAIFAFGLTLGVYLVAKNMGYPLSGFESIGAFAIGWLLGVVYDFLKVMVTGRTLN
jgi:hypothetical protein